MNWNDLKNKYNGIVRAILKKNKKILIDSFVEYYGEKYRKIIETRFNELIFVYYITWEDVEEIIKNYRELLSEEQYCEFMKFYNCYKIIIKNPTKKSFPDNYIGTTDKSVFECYEVRKLLFKLMQSSELINFTYREKNFDTRRVVSFNILVPEESDLIHEINHAITRDLMLYVGNFEVEKVGLCLDVNAHKSRELNIEELLNEKAAQEITKIFRRRGGDLTSICFNLPFQNIYESNFYLINKFYEMFKYYIKMARISDNKNALIKRIGKKEYFDFVKLINAYYREDGVTPKRKSNFKRRLNEILNRMSINVSDSISFERQELEIFYNKLRQAGYQLKILNDIEDETCVRAK